VAGLAAPGRERYGLYSFVVFLLGDFAWEGAMHSPAEAALGSSYSQIRRTFCDCPWHLGGYGMAPIQ